MRWPPLRAQEVSRPTEQQDPHFLHKPDTFPLDTHRLSQRTGLDLVWHLAMTCTNTEKQLFTMDYTLSVPNNALDREGHRMGARYRDRPRGEGTPTCVWPMHMHAGVVCYFNKQRTSLTWHVPHKPHTHGRERRGPAAFVPETESSVGDPMTERA